MLTENVDMIDAAGAWTFFGINGMYGLDLQNALICYLGLWESELFIEYLVIWMFLEACDQIGVVEIDEWGRACDCESRVSQLSEETWL